MSLVLEPLINTTPDMRTLPEGCTPHGWPQLIVQTELILNVSPINWEGMEEGGREEGREGGDYRLFCAQPFGVCFAQSLVETFVHMLR